MVSKDSTFNTWGLRWPQFLSWSKLPDIVTEALGSNSNLTQQCQGNEMITYHSFLFSMHTVLNTWVFICLLEKVGDMEMRRYSLLLEEILQGDVPRLTREYLGRWLTQCKPWKVDCGSIPASSGLYSWTFSYLFCCFICFAFLSLPIWKIGVRTSVYGTQLFQLLDNITCAKCLA